MHKKIGKSLVVGAGISGIRFALDLAETGYGVTLIDPVENAALCVLVDDELADQPPRCPAGAAALEALRQAVLPLDRRKRIETISEGPFRDSESDRHARCIYPITAITSMDSCG